MKFPLVKTTAAFLAFTATAFLAYGAYLSFTTAIGNADMITPPAATIPLSPDHITPMTVATALRHQQEVTHKVKVAATVEDFQDFKAHMNNIAAKRGWLLHASTDYQAKMVMPQAQLHILDGIETNAQQWFDQQENTKLTPYIQPDSSLVNVRLQLDSHSNFMVPFIFATMACIMGAIVTFTLAIIFTADILKDLPRNTAPNH